ncbi:MAG: cytochrome c family protein [Spirochaetia bacterium]|nr:cytochrome c family protein [Spirochaetia bacterium]
MSLIRIFQKHGVKLFVIFSLLGGIAYIFGADTKYQGYAPDQPIPFSHKIHAGELQINCKYCHAGVEVSAHATVPDQGTCMKCHSVVGGDSANIQYLRQTYKQGIPIRWLKVHDLPDHVKFSHKPHITRGFDCATCHGDVQNMDKVELTNKFTMGWCVDCHRQNTTQAYKPGNNQTVKITECGTCHY